MPTKDKAKRNAIQRAWYYRMKEDPAAYAEYKRKANEQNKKNKAGRKNTLLKCKYGITIVEREFFIFVQDFKCAICEKLLPNVDDPEWAVDHCHVGKYVRGMLCKSCNFAIGLLKDNPEVIRKAANYVERTKTILDEPSLEDFQNTLESARSFNEYRERKTKQAQNCDAPE